MKEIELYTTIDGKCPYSDWLDTLCDEYSIRIDKRVNRMREGNFGDWKHLQNSKLSELRLKFGKGYRIYFKELDNVIILIVAGSDKSNQKAVIKQANKYFEDYLSRNNKHDDKI